MTTNEYIHQALTECESFLRESAEANDPEIALRKHRSATFTLMQALTELAFAFENKD